MGTWGGANDDRHSIGMCYLPPMSRSGPTPICARSSCQKARQLQWKHPAWPTIAAQMGRALRRTPAQCRLLRPSDKGTEAKARHERKQKKLCKRTQNMRRGAWFANPLGHRTLGENTSQITEVPKNAGTGPACNQTCGNTEIMNPSTGRWELQCPPLRNPRTLDKGKLTQRMGEEQVINPRRRMLFGSAPHHQCASVALSSASGDKKRQLRIWHRGAKT